MSGMMISINKAKELLKRLFRTENADLDFGIYRIMNFKRTEIERFIEKDLIEAAEAEFKKFAKTGAAELENELNKRKGEINDFVPDTIGDDWEVLKNHDLPKVKEFLRVLEEYQTASVSEAQVQDVLNHVHEFFSRYYADGDFISQTYYGGRDKYFVPYNGEEVLLHWATKNMHYIKTGEFFNKYSFNTGKLDVIFKLEKAQIEQADVKGDKKFFTLHDEAPIQFDKKSQYIEILFNYRALTTEEKEKYGRRAYTKIQEALITEALTEIESFLGADSLLGILQPKRGEGKSSMRKHLESYVKRNTKDFFIHENLKDFLSKELEFYLKNEVWDLNVFENMLENHYIFAAAKMKAIRGISNKIIEFLDQIERFQKKLFEKKKFILQTDYCITLDLVPEEFYEAIGKNEEQLKEWVELFNLKKKTGDTLDPDILRARKHLVLDTKHYSPEFKDKLIAQFDELDDLLNGTIFRSENYQVLNLILHKYDGLVRCVYIDPPFNTGDDDFLYKDKYRHSSWLSLMQERLDLSLKLLANDGSTFVHIDSNENSRLRLLMDDIYGAQNFQTEIVWQRTLGHHLASGMDIMTDTIFYYSKTSEALYNQQYQKLSDEELEEKFPDIEEETGRRYTHEKLEQASNVYSKGEVRSIEDRDVVTDIGWRWSQKEFDRRIQENPHVIYWTGTGRPRYKRYADEYEGRKIGNLWNDISPLASGSKERLGFTTQKPESLLERIILSSTNSDDIVLDFFLGSGTTVAAATKLNRKWIGIEMGTYFDDYPFKRMKMVLSGENSGISESAGWKGGGFFKYQTVEQYEDTLNNIEFQESDGTIQKRLDRFPDYFLTYMLDYETKDSYTRIFFDQFNTPFNYRIKTVSGGEEIEEPIDLVETFNYLLGLHISRFRVFEDDDRLYKVVYGTRGNEQVVVVWRDTRDLDLKRDKEFIETTIIPDAHPDTVYVNGDSYLDNAKPIEPEFKRLMGA